MMSEVDDGRPISRAHTRRAIELAEALVDLRDTEILRLLLACDTGVTEELTRALEGGGRPFPTIFSARVRPPSPSLRAVSS